MSLRRMVIVMCLLAGCGASAEARPRAGGSAPCAHESCQTPEEALAAAVTAFVDSYAEGEATTAWSLVSPRCAAILDEAEFRSTVSAYGVMFSRLEASDIVVRIDGDVGWASYTTGVEEVGPFADQPWSRQDGAWRWDAC